MIDWIVMASQEEKTVRLLAPADRPMDSNDDRDPDESYASRRSAKKLKMDSTSTSVQLTANKYDARKLTLEDEIASEDDASGGPSTNRISAMDDDINDTASDLSDLSCASCFPSLSGESWKPISGPINWVHQQISQGSNPREILTELLPNTFIPSNLDNLTLWRIIINMLSEPSKRKKLNNYNTLDEAVKLISKCKQIIVLTGAGVSVSCGIPDFRSRDGIYARLSKDFPDLPDPQSMFDIHYFKREPRPFYKFAKEIYPGQFCPSPSHKFIKLIEEKGKLLRNYSQNIDTLEQAAGINKVITCHGSFATATCTNCKHKVDSSEIKDDIFAQRIPRCRVCPLDSDMSIMKPDIVFFGEGLSDDFHNAMTHDKDLCDLLIVMGSSLKVRPVALIPSSISPDVPQILINREPLNHHNFDIELLGDCDIIVQEICNRLGSDWESICGNKTLLTEVTELPAESANSDELEVNNNNNNNNNTNSDADSTSNDEEKPDTSCVRMSESRLSLDSKGDSDSLRSTSKTESSLNHPDSTNNDEYDYDEPESSDNWIQKRLTIANNLPENSYLYIPPNRYIFKGAEVYAHDLRNFNDSEDEDDEDDDYYNKDNRSKDEKSDEQPSSSSNFTTELRDDNNDMSVSFTLLDSKLAESLKT